MGGWLIYAPMAQPTSSWTLWSRYPSGLMDAVLQLNQIFRSCNCSGKQRLGELKKKNKKEDQGQSNEPSSRLFSVVFI